MSALCAVSICDRVMTMVFAILFSTKLMGIISNYENGSDENIISALAKSSWRCHHYICSILRRLVCLIPLLRAESLFQRMQSHVRIFFTKYVLSKIGDRTESNRSTRTMRTSKYDQRCERISDAARPLSFTRELKSELNLHKALTACRSSCTIFL